MKPTTLTLPMLALALGGCLDQRPKPVPLPPVAQAETFVGEQVPGDAGVTIIGGQTPPPPVPTTVMNQAHPGDIRLNFPNADVRVVAKAVLGDLLHVSYSVAPGVTGQVNLVTPAPIARESVLMVFENAIKTANLALVPQGDGFTIMTVQAAQAAGATGASASGYSSEVIRLQFINADELKKLLDSVLPGVVIATSPESNSLTIAGTGGQRSSARDLIGQFDVNWLRNMAFAYYTPARTDARLIVPELEKLINAPDAPTRGMVRLIAMEHLNGIIAVSAQRQYLEDVRRWIDVLDREGVNNEPRLFVYRVQNGRSRDLARTLNAAFGNGSSEGEAGQDDSRGGGEKSGSLRDQNGNRRETPENRPAVPESGSNGSKQSAEGGARRGPPVSISSDDANNAVIIFGSPRDYAVVEDALRKLDVPPYQVLIEAAITEVSLNDNLRYGVQWNFQTGKSNFALSEGTGPAPVRQFPGFSYFYSGTDISATLNALEERTNIKVVSAPKLVVLNNQTATLQVGDQVPIQTQSAQSVENPNAPIVNAIEYRDTGVILKITPRVNVGGLVMLDIAQEVSDISRRTIAGISSPIISTRRVATSIAVQDGQVVTLGGLFRDSNSFGKNGLPILSRIPVLGGLFGNQSKLQDRTELLVLIKPHVLRTAEDARDVTEELRAKLRTLEPFRTQGKMP
ncbi:MAG TPA: type II secretion system secretin GspD [Novosphingobium sp.]